MNLSEFNFDLPESCIAQFPLESRADAKLMWIQKETGHVLHQAFRDVSQILKSGDLLIVNNTTVSARRLMGRRATGATVEALFMRQEGEECIALVRPAKKLKIGEQVPFENGLIGTVTSDFGDGLKGICFFDQDDAWKLIRNSGTIPLPPYISVALPNESRYQTVYSSVDGSAAAPTAGLHFTTDVLSELKAIGVEIAEITLDVGLDTFRPVMAEKIEDHKIHGEFFNIPERTAELIEACTGRVIGVGTTTARTLETAAMGHRKVRPGPGKSQLLITPGYEFQIVDGMFTNFHLPKTSMLFMVSAMVGKRRLFEAYELAIKKDYRFLSYGDSMLIL